jgi:hypothetical protein
MASSLLSFVVCLVLFTTTAGQTTCPADPTCNTHRECEFGSLAAYDLVRRVVFNASGCSEQCVNQCECTCGPAGAVYDEIEAGAYCTRSHGICSNSIIQRAMNYNAPGYTCEATFIIAMAPIYTLCATIKGVCANGVCNASYCADTVAPICEQSVGVPSSIQFAMAVYIVTLFFVWQLASSMAGYYRSVRGIDFVVDNDAATAKSPLLAPELLPQPASSSATDMFRRRTTATAANPKSFAKEFM